MVFGNVTNRETAERLGGLVDLVITAVTPYTKFSLFDLDEADGGSGRECVEARGYYNYAHSDPLIVKTQLTGKNTYDESTDTNSGKWCSSRKGTGQDNPSKQWTLIMSRRADR